MFANKTKLTTLTEVMEGADIFLGLSGPGVVKPVMIRSMAENPLVFALSNPIPEILPEEVKATRSDAIIATGRSDYPNQVNNVLCFPFIFRGALDVGATTINDEMKIALVHALADLAKEETPETVIAAYGDEELKFGREYLIPKPFDPRLIIKLAPATAQAAMDSGVATRPIEDMNVYRQQLSHYIFQTVILMRPLFEKAKADPKKLIYAEGEETKILHAVQSVLDEGIAKPILIGKEEIIESRIKQMGLRLRIGKDITIVNPYEYIAKNNITIDDILETNTFVATHMINKGDAEALICGTNGRYHEHFNIVQENLGISNGINQAAAVNVVMVKKGVYFICDTAVTVDPTAEQIAENTLLAAETVKRFGIIPRVALLSFSNGDDIVSETSKKMSSAMEIIMKQSPGLQVHAPIRADAALLGDIRRRVLPHSKLIDNANLLMMPNLDSAKIAYDLVKVLGEGVSIGPILVGLNHPVHILTPSSTVRRIVNATAISVVDSQIKATESGSLL
jgi:malate dehydrogenase (oxaloacetate-decarboxylating)(NADP+)